jgi:hypothetical protein
LFSVLATSAQRSLLMRVFKCIKKNIHGILATCCGKGGLQSPLDAPFICSKPVLIKSSLSPFLPKLNGISDNISHRLPACQPHRLRLSVQVGREHKEYRAGSHEIHGKTAEPKGKGNQSIKQTPYFYVPRCVEASTNAFSDLRCEGDGQSYSRLLS